MEIDPQGAFDADRADQQARFLQARSDILDSLGRIDAVAARWSTTDPFDNNGAREIVQQSNIAGWRAGPVGPTGSLLFG